MVRFEWMMINGEDTEKITHQQITGGADIFFLGSKRINLTIIINFQCSYSIRNETETKSVIKLLFASVYLLFPTTNMVFVRVESNSKKHPLA